MKLAVITSHPVQYYAPWFRYLAEHGTDLRVFYLWDFGVRETRDPGFAQSFVWDIPLLEGYDHEFVPNMAADPGTHHPGGLDNPTLQARVEAWEPEAVLMIGYSWKSMRDLILKRKQLRAPLILRGDSHDLARPRGPGAVLSRWATRWIFSRIDAFLFCGKANKEYFLNRGVKTDQLFFCPHTIDMVRYQKTPAVVQEGQALRQNWGLATSDQLVLFAGKFEEKKRPLDLLKAFRAAGVERAHLAYVGSGPMESQLRSEIAGDPRVHIHPFQNQSLMPAVYASADLFVLPSKGSSETWGLAVQESLACGVPVIASDHVGSAWDLVHPDCNGLRVRAGSVPDLTRALACALEPGKISSWIPHCREALAQHNHEQAAIGLEDAFAFAVS